MVAAAPFAGDAQHGGLVEVGTEADRGGEHAAAVEAGARQIAELGRAGEAHGGLAIGDEEHERHVGGAAMLGGVQGRHPKGGLDVGGPARHEARDRSVGGPAIADPGRREIERGVVGVGDEAEGVAGLEAIDERVRGADRVVPLLAHHRARAIEHQADVHARTRGRLAFAGHERDLEVHALSLFEEAAPLELGVHRDRVAGRHAIRETPQLVEGGEAHALAAHHDAAIHQIRQARSGAAAAHEGRGDDAAGGQGRSGCGERGGGIRAQGPQSRGCDGRGGGR